MKENKVTITKAEDAFFDLIEAGHPVNNDTTTAARCGRALSTVVRRMGYTSGEHWAGPRPIDRRTRIKIKREFLAYNNVKKPQHEKHPAQERNTDEYLITRLKYIVEQLRAAGYEVSDIEITMKI